MDSQRNTAVVGESQELSPTDRRLLLRASLLLFLRRLNHNVPVLREDLLRAAYYAPDEAERA